MDPPTLLCPPGGGKEQALRARERPVEENHDRDVMLNTVYHVRTLALVVL